MKIKCAMEIEMIIQNKGNDWNWDKMKRYNGIKDGGREIEIRG